MKLTPDQKKNLTIIAAILAVPFVVVTAIVVYVKALLGWSEFILGLF